MSSRTRSYFHSVKRLFGLTDTELKKGDAAFRRKEWQESAKHYKAALKILGSKATNRVRARLHKLQQEQEAAQTYLRNKSIYQAVADPEKIIWVKVDELNFKVHGEISRSLARNEIRAGDWDLDLIEIANTAKHRSMIQHFRDGIDWKDTELFNRYKERLRRGEPIRGRTTIEDLARAYESSIDALFSQIKAKGFLLPRERGRSFNDLPFVHIARDGMIVLGRGGNHRLAIAKLLNISHMPCIVYARHAEWQAIRERVFHCSVEEIESLLGPLVDHPDLADLLGEKRSPDNIAH